ncbi:MAG: hypothetical protein GF309_14880 [Candidatus Lokiarchaeota archaeon]|jgi:hypothetical protein|nr:hypothetical protein [Candidatus Lokiarchaeota archaeon]
MVRVRNPLLVTLYSRIVDKVLATTDSIEEANDELREVGRSISTNLYLNTEVAQNTKETIQTREDVSKLVEVVFRELYDRRPDEIDMDTARGSVRITDEECVWCQDVHLEGMRGFGYGEIFSGILEAILELKGVDAKVFQEMSRATGSDRCTWNVRLVW